MRISGKNPVDIASTMKQSHQLDRIFVSQIKKEIRVKALYRPNTQVINGRKMLHLAHQRHSRQLFEAIFNRDEERYTNVEIIFGDENETLLNSRSVWGRLRMGRHIT